jgi:2-isopropylmalate synthase
MALFLGTRIPANRAIKSQDGVLKNPETYEIMTPQLVGVKTTELPLGKLSGKHAFAEKLTWIFKNAILVYT